MVQASVKALKMNKNLKGNLRYSLNWECAYIALAHQKNPTPWNVAPDKNHYSAVRKLIRWSKMERIDHCSATQCYGV